MEMKLLYDLIFDKGDPSENPLMDDCRSKNPATEIKLYRNKIRRRFQLQDTFDGSLAKNFRKSIALLKTDGDPLEDFIASRAFEKVIDIPGYPNEMPISLLLHDYLKGIGSNDDKMFRDQLAIDFYQSLLVEAVFSPVASWIRHFPMVDLSGDKPIVRYHLGANEYVIVISNGKIMRYVVPVMCNT